MIVEMCLSKENIKLIAISIHLAQKNCQILLSNLRGKSMDWFLYDNGLRYERVKTSKKLSEVMLKDLTTLQIISQFKRKLPQQLHN